MRKEVICIEKMVRAADRPNMREALESGIEERLGVECLYSEVWVPLRENWG